MDAIILITAVVTFIYLLITLIEFYYGFLSIVKLNDQHVLQASKLPAVSILFSALNEERDIERVVEALLNMDYPDFEVIAINDRSTDRTGLILNALRAKHPQLKVEHIDVLPAGWFGKNHALYVGSQRARGEWLLFTDADVMMQPDTLTRAMSYAKQHELQHLTICERHTRNSFCLRILLMAVYLMISLALKPWRIKHDWSRRSLGHGAFNFVENKAYQAAGSHAAIAMECLDDLKLGALLKNHGYKQDTVDGRDYVERQWYASLPNMFEGWKKNTFAFFDYRLDYLACGTLFAMLLFVWPVCAMFIESGAAQYFNIANVILQLSVVMLVCRHFRLPIYFALFYPVSIMLLLYSIWNSVFAIYRQDGVIWRGTHYPLATLKAQKE